MSKPHTPDLNSGFQDDSQRPHEANRVAISDSTDKLYDVSELHAALAAQPQSAPPDETIVLPPHPGKREDSMQDRPTREFNSSLSTVVSKGVVSKELPKDLTYEAFIGKAATEAPDAPDVQPPRGTEASSKESFWHRKATKIGGGILALALVAGGTLAAINPWKKDGTDQENAGATPPAATAGSLGVDAPKTSSINTAEGTATVQAQPTAETPATTGFQDGQGAGDPEGTQEALSPADAFLAKGVAAGSGGIAIGEMLPGGEPMVTYHVRDKEFNTHFVPNPEIATAQQIATRELDLVGAYLSASSYEEADLLLNVLTPDLPKNDFATYLKGERANKQATANTDPNGAMLVTFGSNPNNPAVFTKSTKINANGDPITTVTLVSGELYQQSRFVPPIQKIDEALRAPYAPSLTAPVTELTIIVQPRFNSDGSVGDFQTDLGIKYGPNMDQSQN